MHNEIGECVAYKVGRNRALSSFMLHNRGSETDEAENKIRLWDLTSSGNEIGRETDEEIIDS